MSRFSLITASLLFVLLSSHCLQALAQVRQPVAPPQQASKTRPGGIPEWIPLPQDHQKYLDRVLGFWEHTTSETKRYRCAFKRWEYEPHWKTYSEGMIKYSAPDKGLFKIEIVQFNVAKAGDEPAWKKEEDGFREHWICDGKSIFEFDHRNKQLKQRQIPPEMQGQQISDGPLPFLFGAKAEELKNRFWIHVITRKESKGEFWLEAVPKTKADAANFTRLHVILDETDFLPKGMVLFHRNDFQTTFAFEQRETNWSMLAHQLNPFLREFFEPQIPLGWKKIVEPIGGSPAAQSATRQPVVRQLLRQR